MQDMLKSLDELGRQVRGLRLASPLSTVEISKRAGRSRDVLHRLGRSEDVSLSSLLAILGALGQALQIVPAERPTLAEMARRYGRPEGDEP